MAPSTKPVDYSRFDKIADSDEEGEIEEWRLTEEELKAKREKKRDEMIQHELDGYKKQDEMLKRAETQPARVCAEGEYQPPVEPESWSSGRKQRKTKADKRAEREKLHEKLRVVEGILGLLAEDEELQSDLKRPAVVKALKHWTGEARLPPAEAQELFADDTPEFQFHLKPVLGKLSRLQGACKAAGLGVPIDALLAGRKTIWERPPPKPAPVPLTEEERREKARSDFERKIYKNMPAPEPFSWRKLFRQLGLQMAVMSLSVVVFKYFVADRIEAEMAERALEQAEGSRTSTLGGL